MIRHIRWQDLEDKERQIERGDKIYHKFLFLGEVTEVKKRWFKPPIITMSIASHEAKEFIWKERGLNDASIIQLIPTRWAKIKAWFCGLVTMNQIAIQ